MTVRKIRVWDLPTRIFHWSLAATVIAAYFTGESGGDWLVWHGRLGLVVAGLIAFRVVWGILGSTYARFAAFFPTPSAVRAYLRGQWRGFGHNPLGALSVFALLILATLQVGTGLFAHCEDIGYEGPLYKLVHVSVSEALTAGHHKILDILRILVTVHVAAIVFYLRVRKENLVKPMITGEKEVRPAQAAGEPASGGGVAAFTLAAAIAAAAVWAASGTWIESPPPPAAAAPAW